MAKQDLSFLKEIKENVVAGQIDVTKMELALNMIDDWIAELEAAKQDLHGDSAVMCADCGKPYGAVHDDLCLMSESPSA